MKTGYEDENMRLLFKIFGKLLGKAAGMKGYLVLEKAADQTRNYYTYSPGNEREHGHVLCTRQ